jgi:hypothetical protein
MARSRQECAERRERMYDDDIRKAIAAGDDWRAIKTAVDYLLSEARKRREREPGDGSLLNADVAGIVRSIAAQLHALKPERPRGCPRAPRPADLAAVYEEALSRAGGEA